ncbi:MAG TPA: hypothetical protein VK284_10115 [Streptosporangiaceae bacterium]|nr:hypothetical protein [Streptosporangiaceae bacterium]
MLGKFWEAVSGRLADRWATVAAPALVFWLGGLLAWAYHRGGLHELSVLTGWLDRQTNVTQLAVLLTVLLAVFASGVIVDRLTTPMLRLLEGYWPSWLGRLRSRLIKRIQDQAIKDDIAWQELARHMQPSAQATATAEQLATFARLDQKQRRRPATPNRYLPTKVGNILRAGETWPAVKYGLDAVAVWPRLWLMLSDSTRRELIAARAALDSAVAAAIWGLLFSVFTVWAPLALPLGLGVAAVAVTVWAPPRAEIFADLIEAAYDLHRTALYQQLRWPYPTNPKQEHRQGQQLTAYLWRGSEDPDPTFTPPP